MPIIPPDMERQYGKVGCLLSGPGRGDCEHFIGLPDRFDQETTDCYGRPIGWCMPCWTFHRLAHLEAVKAAGDVVTERALDLAYSVIEGPIGCVSSWRYITRETAQILKSEVDAYRAATARLA